MNKAGQVMVTSEIQSLRSRPRFRKYFKAQPDEVLASFETAIKASSDLTGSIATHHVSIRVNKEQEHFWSPQLGLAVEPHDQGCMIRGLYGPKPSIWTMFIFFYTMISLSTLAMFIWGVAQQTLGNYPWAMWFVPGGILTLGGIYLLTQFGQKLSYPQMEEIHTFFLNTLGEFEAFKPEED